MLVFRRRATGLVLLLLLLVLVPVAQVLAACSPPAQPVAVRQGDWGGGVHNYRWFPDSGIGVEDVNRLQLRWVYSLGHVNAPHSWPAMTGDTVYIGDQNGVLHALDRDSGCQRWQFQGKGDIRTAVELHALADAGGDSRPVLYFGGLDAWFYAVDAVSGELLWQRRLSDHPQAFVTGTATFLGEVLYVPLSSYEAFFAGYPLFSCCDFRGALLALDARSGATLWQAYTIDEPATRRGRNLLGVIRQGPSGAPVWSRPTVVPQRNLVLVGTGENYSQPATGSSDAVIAFDLATGARLWQRQLLGGDAWNIACEIPGRVNCPRDHGPDYDFGAPPLWVGLRDGRELVLAGQKSGLVYALDAADGDVVWQWRAGRGGKLGGIHWGMAYDPQREVLYVPVSDRGDRLLGTAPGESRAGVYAIRPMDGAVLWYTAFDDDCGDREGCFPGASAALAATPELVFAGTLDGKLRALSAADGAILWEFDTWGEFDAVNGGRARGAAIDVHGPQIADGRLLVTSGYQVFGQAGGNALMAFRLPEAAEPVHTCQAFMVDGQRPGVCTADYRPVCGITAAGVKATFANACSACSQDDIDTWVEGECSPSPEA